MRGTRFLEAEEAVNALKNDIFRCLKPIRKKAMSIGLSGWKSVFFININSFSRKKKRFHKIITAFSSLGSKYQTEISN